MVSISKKLKVEMIIEADSIDLPAEDKSIKECIFKLLHNKWYNDKDMTILRVKSIQTERIYDN